MSFSYLVVLYLASIGRGRYSYHGYCTISFRIGTFGLQPFSLLDGGFNLIRWREKWREERNPFPLFLSPPLRMVATLYAKCPSRSSTPPPLPATEVGSPQRINTRGFCQITKVAEYFLHLGHMMITLKEQNLWCQCSIPNKALMLKEGGCRIAAPDSSQGEEREASGVVCT